MRERIREEEREYKDACLDMWRDVLIVCALKHKEIIQNRNLNSAKIYFILGECYLCIWQMLLPKQIIVFSR